MNKQDVQFPDNRMLCARECPYCGDTIVVSAEDAIDKPTVATCNSCRSKYRTVDFLTVTCHSAADCMLNNEDHAFEVSDGHIKACVKCGEVDMSNQSEEWPSETVSGDVEFHCPWVKG